MNIRNHIGFSRLVLKSQYFLFFGVVGIFLPFFNLYCYHLDFSGFQIGVLSALRTVSAIVFALGWGMLADRLKSRRKLFIFANFASAALWCLFLFTTDFKAMLVITVLYGIFYSPIISFLEALTMDFLGKDKANYGRIRVWGSLSFILVVLFLGKIISLYSIEIIIILIFLGSVIQAVFSVFIPESASPINKKEKTDPGGAVNVRLIIFLVCAFLMLVSHGTYYGFFSIHLEKLGFSSVFIGFAWALASITEIIVMVKSKAILNRFQYEKLLVFSLFVAFIRWLVLFFIETPFFILLSQTLHAVTYGIFHISSILYMDHLSKEGGKTFGQAVNNAVTYGLGMMIGFLVNGYFFDTQGKSLFLFSSFIALLGGGILWCHQAISVNRAGS